MPVGDLAGPEGLPEVGTAGHHHAGMGVHQYESEVEGTKLWYQVVSLDGQVLVWVSSDAPTFANLSLAINLRDDKAGPAVSHVLGPETAGPGEALARKLCRRLGQAVFCSWNVNTADPLVIAHAERTIADKLRDLKIMR